MGLTKYKLGELIELVQDTNSELQYGPDDVKGMTITKEVIPTKANVSETDLSKFLVVHPGEFIYNPRTHGKRIGFGYNNTNDNFIISWNNIAFKVKPSMKKIVLADYLFLHFKRDEWDREACYQSWGSSTEVFSWDTLCDMSVDLPVFSIQQKYVDVYNAMLENQKSYECGLEDLKLVCDAYIEDLRRQMPCEAIATYVEEVNKKNIGNLKLDSVRGIATSKEFINTKANMEGVSLENYKVVEPGMIAFISDTSRRADKMSLALNQSGENYLVSSISTVIQTDSKDADENMKAMVSKPYAKVLKEAFPHATFVGFTGTPIAETYQTFGDEIDRYTMDQAVVDGLTVSIKYHPRIAKVLLDNKKVKEIENYYKKCADDGATYEDIEASKKAMSSMEIILGEPSRLERLATDIHNHYVASCAGDPDRIQKAMVVCSNRKIAYALLQKFKDKYPEWFEEKKSPDGVSVTEEELKELKPMPFMAMVSSVGSNDEKDMYDYLGGVKNDKRSEELDAAFKQEKSNFSIVIVVDMWITGFDVPCLTYLYNDKPLKKHLLIQTISRVNRKYPGKEYGMVIDYIGIRDNMREAMKVYGGDTSVAPTADDVEQATSVFREELEVLKNMFTGYDLSPFLNPECDPIERYRLLAKAAEYVFVSTEELQSEGNKGVQKVSFKTYYLKTVKRMRAAFDICQPSGYLGEEESALAQCFMAIAGFVRKMSGTSEVDADTMNRAVSKMVEEALKYNQVESVLESGEEEDIFSPEYFEKLSDVKMPATKLELLVKMLRKQIKEYGKVNQLAAKSYQEMLEKTIAEYHERRKHLTAEEAGEAQEQASEDVIKIATEQALAILRQMNENRESFRKIGLTFEEKAFYDILISLRDQYNFEYGTDKEVDGVIVNDKCKALAKKIKDIIDTKSSFADWLNNQNVRNGLKLEIKICLVKNGYPPQYSPEVFNKVMEQVENFEEYSGTEGIGNEASTSGKIYEYKPEYKVMMVAEDSSKYGDSKNNQ